MSLVSQNKINQLLLLGTRNGLFFSEWLKKNGYSDQLVSKYRQSGWLSTLAKGVMFRTGDVLSAYAASCGERDRAEGCINTFICFYGDAYGRWKRTAERQSGSPVDNI